MVNLSRLKSLIFIFIVSCVLLNNFINASPLQETAVNELSNDQTKLTINNEKNEFMSNIEENKISDNLGNKLKSDDDDDDDKGKEGDKEVVPSEIDKQPDKEDDKKEDKKDDEDDDDKKVEEKKDENKAEASTKKIDEKLDENQKETKTENPNFDDSSQEDDSHSNPDTEEVGSSESESDEDDKPEEKEPVKGKLENKLLIILASGFRYDYVHIQKLNAIKEILKTGVTTRVKPAFPSNSYPNYYAMVTGLQPVKNGFIDDEMYDVKYKEHFSGKAHNHKHWWNKAEPLWITAMNNKIKVGTYWWKGACGITIKGRTPKNCVPYKEKVSNAEVSKQLESIVEQFSENKLDLALVSYEKIDEIGHAFGPESYKLRKAVRNLDKILEDLLKEIDEKKIEDKVNIVVVSDHGMISIGERIDLEKLIDFNDIDKFVNSGTFAMLLPEDNKKDYVFNLLRNSHVEGLNVYKKPDFPDKFNFKGDSELILPIVLTADKGYYIGEPSVDKDGDGDDDSTEEPKKGNHGYHPLHVREMNAGFFATGPDFEKNHVVNSIDQVDLYNIFCKLIKIKPLKNDGNKDIVDDFLHDSSSEEHGDDDNQGSSGEDSGDMEDGYAPEKKRKDNLPVFRSRWALRGAANSVTLNISLELIVLLITLMAFVRI